MEAAIDLSLIMGRLHEAGRFLLRVRQSELPISVSYETDGPVSGADLAVHHFVTAFLAEVTPEIPVISEEGNADWESLLQIEKLVWILDPLDGTVSYLEGGEEYGIQLALVSAHRVVAAWIICPSLEWHAFGWQLNSAARRLEIKGSRAAEAEPPSAIESMRAVLAIGDFAEEQRRRIQRVATQLRDSRGTKSCAFDYLELLMGRRDLLLYKRTLPWDHAPGVFLAELSGAIAYRHDLQPYRLMDRSGGLLVFRNPELTKYKDYFL